MAKRLAEDDRNSKRVRTFEYLPADCWRIILSFVTDVPSFGRLAATCRETRSVFTPAKGEQLRDRLRSIPVRTDGHGFCVSSRLPGGRLDGAYTEGIPCASDMYTDTLAMRHVQTLSDWCHQVSCPPDSHTITTATFRNGILHGEFTRIDPLFNMVRTSQRCQFHDGNQHSGALLTGIDDDRVTSECFDGSRLSEDVARDIGGKLHWITFIWRGADQDAGCYVPYPDPAHKTTICIRKIPSRGDHPAIPTGSAKQWYEIGTATYASTWTGAVIALAKLAL